MTHSRGDAPSRRKHVRDPSQEPAVIRFLVQGVVGR